MHFGVFANLNRRYHIKQIGMICLILAGMFACGKNNFITKATSEENTTNTTDKPTVSLKNAEDFSVSLLAAGDNFSCAAGKKDASGKSSVFCWGKNDSGQLAAPIKSTPQTSPAFVQGLSSNVISIAAGNSFGCLLSSGNFLRCWGKNDQGQLGANGSVSAVPVMVQEPFPDSVEQMRAGFLSTCFLMSSGTVQCVGQNNSGKFANSLLAVNTNTMVPVDSDLFAGRPSSAISQMQHTNNTTVLLMNDGTLWCAGTNSAGQCGQGNFNTSVNSLTSVPLPVGVVIKQVFATPGQTFVLSTGNQLFATGANVNYNLGDGTNVNRSSLTLSSALASTNIRALPDSLGNGASSSTHMCVLTSTGGVRCWGQNSSGQVGANNLIDPQQTPVSVVDVSLNPISSITSVSIGGAYTCALRSDGTVWCWGVNNNSNLGNNNTVNMSYAVPVSLPEKATAVVTGSIHTCAILVSKRLMCWGANLNGQVGVNSLLSSITRVPNYVQGLPDSVESVTLGTGHTCALLSNKTVRCWGSNSNGQIAANDLSLNRLTAHMVYPFARAPASTKVVAGGGHVCVLQQGNIKCFGRNTEGQLGLNTTVSSSTPLYMRNQIENFQDIGVGDAFSCVLGVSGMMYCTGDNTFGQLGNRSNNSSLVLTPINMTGVFKMGVGRRHVCAIDNSLNLFCWGANDAGQLGDNSNVRKSSPQRVNLGSEKAQHVVAGLSHTCVLTSSKKVFCFGSNRSGQLGVPDLAYSLVPVEVSVLSKESVREVIAGERHTCAVTDNDKTYCWGANDSGQLGDGTTTDSFQPLLIKKPNL